MTAVVSVNSEGRREKHTEITADAVKPVRTVRFAVMNLVS